MRRNALSLALAAGLAAPAASQAVYLNPDGLGQALIYPYYSVRAASGNEFNTYVSVVNHTAQAKVVRVTFREARNSRVVQSFNLYLAPNDLWTGAVVSQPAGSEAVAVLVSSDTSCTNPPATVTNGVATRTFQSSGYSEANADALGGGLDRTREGWIEMIEMATVVGDSAAAVTHGQSGVPPACGNVQGTPALTVAAPTGGLSGTLTLINVGSGQDFSVNAEALADLSTQPFYRPPADPYPAFNASEITPVSTFTANGSIYRSVWNRGVDAVSAALLRSEFSSEFTFDNATRSLTALVATFPTRSYYGSGAASQAPFSPIRDAIRYNYFNREARGAAADPCDIQDVPCIAFRPSTTLQLSNGAIHQVSDGIFGSGGVRTRLFTTAIFQNGVTHFNLSPLFAQGQQPAFLTSLPSSTRMDLATGAVTTGAHVLAGMPVVGFGARTFENGTLNCGAGTRCQGNYGSAFPFNYRREIVAPVP